MSRTLSSSAVTLTDLRACCHQVVTQEPQQETREYRAPTGPYNEYILEDDECPLAILVNHPPMPGEWRGLRKRDMGSGGEDTEDIGVGGENTPLTGVREGLATHGQSWSSSTIRGRLVTGGEGGVRVDGLADGVVSGGGGLASG